MAGLHEYPELDAGHEMLEAIKATGDEDLVYEFQLAVLCGTNVIGGINAG